jgi:NAD-dependent DNA ligase
MGEGTVEKFVANGFDDIWKILTANKNEIKQIEGLGAKSVEKIYESIDQSLNSCKLCDLMSASQQFGRGIGSKKFKLITDLYPNVMELYKTKGKDHMIKLINSINGFDVKTTNKIVDSMDDFIDYYKKLLKIKPNIFNNQTGNQMGSQTSNQTNSQTNIEYPNLKKYIGQTIVFTGFRDKNLQNILESSNIKLSESVSKKTNLVVCIDPNESSSKLTKAKDLGIQIITKDNFIKSIK